MNSTLNFIDGHQISYAVAGACALFLFLLLLFELLRTRLYWIYEPRVHRDYYKSKTPPAPGRTPFAWMRCVFEHWSDYEQYAGVDGVVLAHILRYLTDQCLFAAVVGFLVLIPTYVTGDGLSGYGDGYGDKPDGGSFSWCFRRNSPLYWLQGHAVWHVLTMGALGCIYWFFRSEKISYS